MMNDKCKLITPENIQGEVINNEIEQINLRVQAFKEQKYNELLKENQELKKENKILRENAEHNDKVVDKVNWENLIIKSRIHKTINFIEATIQIINQQPSRNVEEDNFILGRLESFIKILGGDVDDE